MANSFLLLFTLVSLAFGASVDPLCAVMKCPPKRVCRVVRECKKDAACSLQAQCLKNIPKYNDNTTGKDCNIGRPIVQKLEKNNWEEAACHPGAPCPEGSFCKAVTAGKDSHCCLSDPARPVNKGKCPKLNDMDTTVCVDTCGNDGDCGSEDKCCQTGCRKECLRADPDIDPCQKKTCPNGNFCLRPDMKRCQDDGECFNVGDCVPCPYLVLCMLKCNEFATNSDGCPKCQCKKGPRPPPPKGVKQPFRRHAGLYPVA